MYINRLLTWKCQGFNGMLGWMERKWNFRRRPYIPYLSVCCPFFYFSHLPLLKSLKIFMWLAFPRYYILKGNTEGTMSCFPFCFPLETSLLFQVFHLKKSCHLSLRSKTVALVSCGCCAAESDGLSHYYGNFCHLLLFLAWNVSFPLSCMSSGTRLPLFFPSGDTKPSESRGFLRSCSHGLASGCSWGRNIFWDSVFCDRICTFPFRGGAEGWTAGFFWPWAPLKIIMLVLLLDLCCFVPCCQLSSGGVLRSSPKEERVVAGTPEWCLSPEPAAIWNTDLYLCSLGITALPFRRKY